MALTVLLIPGSHHLFTVVGFTGILSCQILVDATHVDSPTIAFAPVDAAPAGSGPWLDAFALGACLIFPVPDILVVADAASLTVLLVIAGAPVLPSAL